MEADTQASWFDWIVYGFLTRLGALAIVAGKARLMRRQ